MIRVQAKTEETSRYLEGLIRDQLPFALSLGLNNLGIQFVEIQQIGIETRFTIRRPGYILPSVKMTRGTKQKPEVRVFIDPERDILAKFELGGVKRPGSFGSRVVMGSIAIPVDHRATNEDGSIRMAMLPSNLGLAAARRLGKDGSTQLSRAGMKGKRRTFVIPPGRSFGLPSGAIMQRIGPGKRDLALLFVLKPKIPIPPILEFEKTGKRVAEQHWPVHMSAAVEKALATAR